MGQFLVRPSGAIILNVMIVPVGKTLSPLLRVDFGGRSFMIVGRFGRWSCVDVRLQMQELFEARVLLRRRNPGGGEALPFCFPDHLRT